MRVHLSRLIAGLLFLGAAALLLRQRLILPYRWRPEVASDFTGWSLVLLAAGLLFLAVFSWNAGTMLKHGQLPIRADLPRADPARRRRWWLVLNALAAIGCVGIAFLLAAEVPNPQLLPP